MDKKTDNRQNIADKPRKKGLTSNKLLNEFMAKE